MSIDQATGTVPPLGFFIRRLIAYRPLMSLARSMLELSWRAPVLADMLLAKAFFDTLQGHPTAGLSLGAIILLTLVLHFVSIGLALGREAVGISLAVRLVGLLRHNLFARVLERPGARALPGSVGEALSTLRDDADDLEWVSMLPLDLLTDLIFFGAGLAILLSVDVGVTLLVFIPLGLIVALSEVGKWRLEHAHTQSREAAARFSGGLGEVLAAVQAVQVAGAEGRVIAHLRQLGEARGRATLRDWLQQEAWGKLFDSAVAIGMGLILLAAANKMRSGAFTVGDLALFVAYLQEVNGYLVYGGRNLVAYRLARVSLRRLLALLQGPAERLVEHHPLPLRGPLPPLAAPVTRARHPLQTLQVEGLTLRHPASGGGIEDVSFALGRGTLTVVAGRIGAGKSTLLRALLGLLPPDAGEMWWNGVRVDDPAAFFQPPRAGYTPQVPSLLSDTLRENILLGWTDGADSLARAVHRAVLERDVETFPHGLDTPIGVRGMKLSGGQAQRTAAARMLVREPELLVMDDTSSALDVETERVLWERLLGQGATCLVVSHRRAVLERADQILLLREGRLVASGTLEELLGTSEEMRRLYVAEGSDLTTPT